jgi:hypothetical protein
LALSATAFDASPSRSAAGAAWAADGMSSVLSRTSGANAVAMRQREELVDLT